MWFKTWINVYHISKKQLQAHPLNSNTDMQIWIEKENFDHCSCMYVCITSHMIDSRGMLKILCSLIQVMAYSNLNSNISIATKRRKLFLPVYCHAMPVIWSSAQSIPLDVYHAYQGPGMGKPLCLWMHHPIPFAFVGLVDAIWLAWIQGHGIAWQFLYHLCSSRNHNLIVRDIQFCSNRSRGSTTNSAWRLHLPKQD